MDRGILYLFADGSWLFGADYQPTVHADKGKYHEIIVGRGWSSREIDEMLKPYFEENAAQIFG